MAMEMEPLPTPLGALESRLKALEKIQTDQTLVMTDFSKRLDAVEIFRAQAEAMAQKIQKKTGGLFGGMFP